MKVMDLFAGVGGFSKGFEIAGYEIIVANEIDYEISKSYKFNHKKTAMYNMSIFEFIEESHLYKNKIDIIIGGPPCQGFSMAGKRNRGLKKKSKDPRNTLFEEYVKVVNIVEPKYFVMENVKGMKSLDAGVFYKQAISQLKALKYKNKHYNIYEFVLKFSDFGVPQERERVIIIGSYKELNVDDIITPNYSIIKKYGYDFDNSIWDAISDLNYLQSGEEDKYTTYKLDSKSNLQDFYRKNSFRAQNHKSTKHNDIAIDRMSRVKQGENRNSLIESEKIKSVHSGAYGRMKWNQKAKTIITRFDTPSSGEYIHPELNRTITLREAARLQSFPDDFIFIGSKSSILKQIGNAVPPLFAVYLAEYLKKEEKKGNLNG